MKNPYEVLFIVKPDAGEEVLKGIVQKVRDAVEGLKGEITKVDEWGKRHISYSIQKYREGCYTLVNFSGDSAIPKEIERLLKLNENVLRFQTVKAKRKMVKDLTKKGEEVKGA